MKKMKWITQRKIGYSPAQIEVVWDRGNGFYTQVAETVCPHRPGDLPEKQRNEVAAIIANAPDMLELLRSIAYPQRGSKEEKWSIDDLAAQASKVIAKIEISVTV